MRTVIEIGLDEFPNKKKADITDKPKTLIK